MLGNLILGSLPLGVNTVTYDHISKQYTNNWASQDRINNSPSLQNTGSQAETLSISGVSLPSNSAVEAAALITLRTLAENKTPSFLFNAEGLIYGKWVIVDFGQDQSNGDKTTYTINLQRYPEKSLLEQSKAFVKSLLR